MKSPRKSLTVLLATATVGLGVSANVPAMASTTITWNGTSLSQSVLATQVGESFTIERTDSSPSFIYITGPVSVSGTSCLTTNVVCIVDKTISANPRTTFTVDGLGIVDVRTPPAGSFLLSTLSLFASSNPPPPVLQSFGRPVTGTCDEVASEDLNWSGVASGGWSESWGRWEGYEGHVCTHTLVYSNALAKWTVS